MCSNDIVIPNKILMKIYQILQILICWLWLSLESTHYIGVSMTFYSKIKFSSVVPIMNLTVTDIAFTGAYRAMCCGMSILDVVAVMISPSQVDSVLRYHHYIYI